MSSCGPDLDSPGAVDRACQQRICAGGGLVELVCFWGRRSKRGKSRLRASWNKLGIAKTLVIAIISEELGGVVEKMTQVLVRNTSLGLQALPIPTR